MFKIILLSALAWKAINNYGILEIPFTERYNFAYIYTYKIYTYIHIYIITELPYPNFVSDNKYFFNESCRIFMNILLLMS